MKLNWQRGDYCFLESSSSFLCCSILSYHPFIRCLFVLKGNNIQLLHVHGFEREINKKTLMNLLFGCRQSGLQKNHHKKKKFRYTHIVTFE